MPQRSSNQFVVTQHASAMKASLAHLLPAGVALAVTVGALFNGLDNAFGNAVACLLLSTTALAVFVALPIDVRSLKNFAFAASPLVAAAVWAMVVSINGFVPDLILSEALGLASAGLALFCGTQIGRQRAARFSTQHWLVAFGAIVAVLSCAAPLLHEALALQMWAPGQNGRFAGTFGNANVAGAFFATLAILTLATILGTKESRRPGHLAPRIDWQLVSRWLVLLIAVAACAATASRTAITSAIPAIALLLTIRLFKRGQGKHRSPLLLSALAAGGLVLLLIGAQDLQYRFGSVSGDWSVRQLMWSHYATIAAGSPLTGYGLGSFPTVNMRFLSDAALAQELWSVNAAHNILIQLVIDAGLPYLVLIALFMLRVARDIFRALRVRPSLLEWGKLLAVGIILVNAMVDIVLEIPMMILLFWTLVGLLWGRAQSVEVRRPELPPAEHERDISLAAAH